MTDALIGLNTEELRSLAEGLGEPPYRGNQLAHWVYRRGAHAFEEMTDLPKALRGRLAEGCTIGRSRLVVEKRSGDGTLKLLLALSDDERVETVGLPYSDRVSCCVSTQVGCPVRCAFCATGMSGYARNLSAGEIVDQVLSAQEALGGQQAADSRPRVSHVVFMGMGEPLLNYDATLKAVRLLNEELGIGMRRITISTVGYVPGIRKLARERLQATLAISLHAPTDALRRQLIPTMTRWAIADILAACREYVAQTRRRLTFEYCLLKDVNDGVAEGRLLAQLLRGLNCHVNLIPFNPVYGTGFEAPDDKRIRAFRETLERGGIAVTQRVQRGSDVDAACGQLRRRVGEAAPVVSPGLR